ncbi:hypothetical protein AURDEDRAFT_123594 [Auricularia subglabra TFB-10046 SS5]|nr:hypothetical protein AURDEDRAFT_123594 [Auricularia subglabra TFB-10046 SS5]
MFTNLFPDLALSRSFPAMCRRHLAFRAKPSASPPSWFRFDGLRLQALIIEDLDEHPLMPAVVHSPNVTEIPTFEHIAASCGGTNRSGGKRTSAPSVFYSNTTEWQIRMSTRHLHMRHPDEECHIVDLPRITQRLTYLHMDNRYLIALRKTR